MWNSVWTILTWIIPIASVIWTVICIAIAVKRRNSDEHWRNLAIASAALSAVLFSVSLNIREGYLNIPDLSLSTGNIITHPHDADKALRCLIKVTNNGNREARNCLAKLTIKDIGGWQLCWYQGGAVEDPVLDTIRPKDNASVCIITSEESAIKTGISSRAWVASPHIWTLYRRAFEKGSLPPAYLTDDQFESLRPGKYELSISIFPENGNSITGAYELIIGDNFTDFKINKIK